MRSLIICAGCFCASAAAAQPLSAQPTTNHSFTLTAGTITVVLPYTGVRYYERLVNVGTTGIAWCSRYDTSPAANKPGSFPLAPYGNALGLPASEEFPASAGGFAPPMPLYCTADVGTAAITGESLP